MSALAEFLLARIAEDEAVAESLRGRNPGDPWGWQPYGYQLETCAKSRVDFPPARVLAECAAKRRAVEEAFIVQAGSTEVVYIGDTVRKRAIYPSALAMLASLASVYADHPDYDESWKP